MRLYAFITAFILFAFLPWMAFSPRGPVQAWGQRVSPVLDVSPADPEQVHTATSSSTQSLVYKPGTLRLTEGQKVGNSNLNLIMQADGNLVVYANGQALWASDTMGKCPGCIAQYQGDGNLVLYDNMKKPVWALNSVGSKELFIRNTAPQVSTFEIPPRQIEVVTADGKLVCNSVSFTQFPDEPKLFVGRLFHYADEEPVVGTAQECWHPKKKLGWTSLALFRMDWNQGRLVLGNTVFQTKQQLPSGSKIISSYDPYLAKINGQNYIAFECFGLFSTVNACVAPLLPDHTVDISRLTVPVIGRFAAASASVPKLLLFNDRVYLYWSVAYGTDFDPLVTTRGMEVTTDASGRLWGVESIGKSVMTDDSHLTHLVAAPNPQDSTANREIEVESLRVVSGNQIEALVGAGGIRKPEEPDPAFYRLQKSFASNPLGENAFGKELQPTAGLPVNHEGYSRYFVGPDGRSIIMGVFYQSKSPYPGKTVPNGYWQFPAE
jgi:hypothetical protein